MAALRICTALIGLAVPISTALDNLLLALIMLGLFFNAPPVWRIVMHNPVARAASLLFGMLTLAMAYGVTPMSVALGVLGKYIDLAFVPLFMLMFAQAKTRAWAERAYIGAMGLTLLLSYLLGLHVIGVQSWMSNMATTDNPVIFHSHITQNNMMAYAAFLAMLKCRDAMTTKLRLAWLAFAALATINVLFMVQGRTGYIILLVLLCWFAWTTLERYFLQRGQSWGWKQGVMVLLASIFLVTGAYLASPRLHQRVSLVAAEIQAWQPNQENQSSSTGTRLNFYYNAIQIITKHPLLGVGTGGFEAAFTSQIQGTNLSTTPNPHNEFLLISAQTGLIGLALMVYLFATLWRTAPRLDTAYGQDAARGLVLAYVVNCALNSALHDHADGLFFAWMTALLFSTLLIKKHG
ncbi:MAG: O-antigen ligase family protein [Gallionella sp.]|nr:O-antigen ligase family protein [Gallionella sp.]